MEQTPPVVLQFDGTNADQVLDSLREQNPDNPPVRGGVHLEPPAPGEPMVMTVELADGTILTQIEEL